MDNTKFKTLKVQENINKINDRMKRLEQLTELGAQHPSCLANSEQIGHCQEIITSLLVRDAQRQHELNKLLQLNKNLFELITMLRKEIQKHTRSLKRRNHNAQAKH